MTASDRQSADARFDELLRSGWQSYQRELERCRKRCSPKRVHRLRVSLRTLMAIIELDTHIIRSKLGAKITRELDKQLDELGELRDTQVERKHVRRYRQKRPELKRFMKHLEKRERLLLKDVSGEIRKLNGTKLKKSVKKLSDRLETLRHDELLLTLVSPRLREALYAAFMQVRRRRRAAEKGTPKEIHRLRVAFKKYRYMIEVLYPKHLKLSDTQLEELRSLQTIMGDLQDNRVLLTDITEWAREKPKRRERLSSFRSELLAKQKSLVESLTSEINSSRWLFLPVVQSPREE